jgi:FtsZ-binding cell division protein ZapB
MTRKHGIRAPTRPRNEDAATTMSNQDKQITLLINRVEQLMGERDEAVGKVGRLEDQVDNLKTENDHMNRAHIRLLGWQDAVRELTPKFTLED